MMVDNDEYRQKIINSPVTDSIVVQAGPGSGKTTLLIERLKYFIQNRSNVLSGIACITYTNSAKDEILNRLEKNGVSLPPELFVGTIHSFLLEYVIKPYSYVASKTAESFILLPPGFSRGYYNEIRRLLNIESNYIPNRVYESFESLGYDRDGNECCFRNAISHDIAKEWKKLLHEKHYIDQQDIIYLSYLILNKFKHIAKALSIRFPQFLVDEYQDVTWHQDQIFSMLENSSFFCVGDFNQSIFGFTGADLEVYNKKKEKQNFYELSNNFRSTNHIIRFANNKTTVAQIGAGTNAGIEQKVYMLTNIEKEIDAIKLFHRVREHVECDTTYKQFMILGRKTKYLRNLYDIVKAEKIQPNTFLGNLKEKDYRRFEILNNILLAILYKREGELDKGLEMMDMAFSRLFFNKLPNYIQIEDIKYERLMWKKLQIALLNYIDTSDLKEIFIKDFFISIKEFLATTSETIYKIKIKKHIQMLNYNWKGQLKAVKKISIYDLLEQMKFQVKSVEKEKPFYTIHEAKGQEAECVLVLAEGEKQLQEWIGDNRDSEEARVGYVAFSRARKLLCIWAPSITEETYNYMEEYIEFIDEKHFIKVTSV
ncbi:MULTISPECIES: UvrD-helicase domain-containing protein [Bacillus cereus group]|uniref:UvrD-helicase domain-containing protein n=1 Tax=Bacillus cereus group TaxID=86661 RepID=UPI0008CF1566|nr:MULTISPECIES: ATP-dependent helicase [Bacillus cereus group]PEM52041.1 ATP-dependent helicase [Bacillus wiedmannii]SEJ69625.1 Superfamily I DNA or RNA helicase [Bacillus thuringiensis]